LILKERESKEYITRTLCRFSKNTTLLLYLEKFIEIHSTQEMKIKIHLFTHLNLFARFVFLIGLVALTGYVQGQITNISAIDGADGYMGRVGDRGLRVLTPTVLEIAMVNTQPVNGGLMSNWNFFTAPGDSLALPPISSIQVTVNQSPVAANYSGFRRRPLYAPLSPRDSRVDNRLFLSLSQPIAEGDTVQVTMTDVDGPNSGSLTFSAAATVNRFNAALHVNQEGYDSDSPKIGLVGYYLGSGGELDIPSTTFTIVDRSTNHTALTGTMVLKPDIGFMYLPTPYQKVYSADFSALKTTGSYELRVPGMGSSLPFRIHNGALMNVTRTYALGLYNQRCGHALTLPFTRHTHPPCHTALALVPASATDYAPTWNFISAANADFNRDPRHTAPRMDTPAAQLYPFIQTGPIDVSGGHHDAGDYSKYTINSAQMCHRLVFAADAFPGVGAMDNLGIPESGDGKSDILQEAKIEADFLAKMQDSDGGFYFLVYPRTRKYEDNVLPQNGDQQVVWPKNTASTAAATAALAEIGSSPLFKAQYPVEAALYMQKATAGWAFLMQAVSTYGKDGSYQKITGYGDIFLHDDELAWAASAMFAATGDTAIQNTLISWYTPSSPATRRWSWWRLFEGYGGAARTLAFAARTGRLLPSQMNSAYLAVCETEVVAAGEDIWRRSNSSAYGVALAEASKRQRTAGWFFASNEAFDITTAYQLSPQPKYEAAVISNLNYELGCNPVNASYITGLGSRRQREIVHQYARNDERILPPSGLPLGTIQAGSPWMATYGSSLGPLGFPNDGLITAPYPFYDRWVDSFNTTTEFVVPQQAASVASLAFWAARTETATQQWVVPNATITAPSHYTPVNQPITVTLECPGLDLSDARVIWESTDQDVKMNGPSWTFTPTLIGTQWIEAEATLPDGRRITAQTTYQTIATPGFGPFLNDGNTIALYHLDNNSLDYSGNGNHMIGNGTATLAPNNVGWMGNPSGGVARFTGLAQTFTATIPDSLIMPTGTSLSPITIEAWIYPRAYKAYTAYNCPLVSLSQHFDSSLELEDGKWNTPPVPHIRAGATTITTPASWLTNSVIGTWQHLRMTLDANGLATTYLNGVVISSATTTMGHNRTNPWTLTIGNFIGDIDEVRVSRVARTEALPAPYVSDPTALPPTTAITPPNAPTPPNPPAPPAPPVLPPSTGLGSGQEFPADANTVALWHFDTNYQDSVGTYHLNATGNVTLIDGASWMAQPAGKFVRFTTMGDRLSIPIPDVVIGPSPTKPSFSIEAWIRPRAYKGWGIGSGNLIGLNQHWDASIQIQDGKWNIPSAPIVYCGTATMVSGTAWNTAVKFGIWHKLTLNFIAPNTFTCYVNQTLISTATVSFHQGRTNDWVLTLGNFDGDIDEVRLSDISRIPTP
jgi:Glycosyl hydrolase family 9/Cellulase N-terminal ig-like domain/Concanavalin A-like lectin/glucanases superfamily